VSAALVLTAVVVVVLLAFLARLVAVLDEIDLTVRTLTTAVRAAARGAEEITPAAEALGQNATAADAALARLEELKRGPLA
jgi:uncharacterized protein YoxC